jgi:hypothetical protein
MEHFKLLKQNSSDIVLLQVRYRTDSRRSPLSTKRFRKPQVGQQLGR